MKTSSLQLAKGQIENFLRTTKGRIYKRKDILRILAENREEWKLAGSTKAGEFLNYLKQIGLITKHELKFPQRKEVRFVQGEVSEYELILSIRPDGYFSHYTALVLHKLVDKKPDAIYFNCEQRPKHRSNAELVQDRIDYAFQSRCRLSKNYAKFNGKRVYLLNGKYTGGVGVTLTSVGPKSEVRVASVERTLIDCTVRPIYSGGVRCVLEAFRAAVGRIAITSLLETLNALDYLYPYHQAIGFYLERSGVYTDDDIASVAEKEKRFDFYLTHNMKNPRYSKKWRLYFPRGF